MTGTHAEEIQLGKWAWGYMQTQYIRGDILYCTASKGQKRTKVETKMLTALSSSFSLSPENPYVLLHSESCPHSISCASLVQLKLPIFFV